MIQGRDYSHWEPNPDLAADKAAGVRFCIDKCTDGVSLDPTFAPRRELELALGLLSGGYHYYRDVVDPVLQARFHVDHNPAKLKVVDLEPGYNPTFTVDHTAAQLAQVQAKVYTCCAEVGNRTGVKPAIYTNWNTWHYVLHEPSWGAEFLLWVASYPGVMTPTSQPLLPDTWKTKGWTFWQSADHTDWFNGTEAQLNQLFGANVNTIYLPVVFANYSLDQRLEGLESWASAQGYKGPG